MNILQQILIPILSSFLIAFLTSRLCFKLYFTLRDDSQDQHKLIVDQLKKWQALAISFLAYSLPSDIYGFWEKGQVSIALTVAVAVSLAILIFIYYLKPNYMKVQQPFYLCNIIFNTKLINTPRVEINNSYYNLGGLLLEDYCFEVFFRR